MSSATRQQLEAWLKTISVNAEAKVLDVGGSQKPVKSRLGQKGENSEYIILDLEQPHEVEQAPDIIFDLNKPMTRAQKILEFGKYESYFDVVFCLEVMEYLWNPVGTFDTIHYFMKHGASLMVSSPFLYPVHNPYQYDYLRYTEAGMRKILTETGFEIIDVTPRTAEHTNLTEAFYSLEGMKPSREFEGHDHVGHLICAKKV